MKPTTHRPAVSIADKNRPWAKDLGYWTTISTVALIALGFGAMRAQAQNAAAMDQVGISQQRRSLEQSAELKYETGETAPSLYPGETEDVGPQSVLAVKPRRTLFQGMADIQYYYTDNAFLDHSVRYNSGVMVSTVNFALAPTPYPLWGGLSAPRIGYQSQWFNFFQYAPHDQTLGSFDFNSQTVFLDETWTWHNNWQFGVGFDYTRLLTMSDYHEFYSEYTPRWAASYITPIGQKSAFSVGYQGYYHFTHAPEFQFALSQPESNFYDRLDQMLLASFTYAPCEHVVLQPYYTFRYTHFTQTIHRDDYLNSVGVGAYYQFCKAFTARLFTTFDHRNSNVTQAQYNAFSAGVGANATVRF